MQDFPKIFLLSDAVPYDPSVAGFDTLDLHVVVRLDVNSDQVEDPADEQHERHEYDEQTECPVACFTQATARHTFPFELEPVLIVRLGIEFQVIIFDVNGFHDTPFRAC